MKKYGKLYGKPNKLLSDNGPQFCSRTWKKGLRELGIQEVHTSIRNPRGNPCERYIKLVAECLRIECMNQHSSWAKSLVKIEKFINHQYSSVTGELPLELQWRRKCSLELEKYINYTKSSMDVN